MSKCRDILEELAEFSLILILILVIIIGFTTEVDSRRIESEDGIMPKELHDALDEAAKRHGYEEGTEEYNRYVYGTMERIEQQKEKNEDSEESEDESESE